MNNLEITIGIQVEILVGEHEGRVGLTYDSRARNKTGQKEYAVGTPEETYGWFTEDEIKPGTN